MRLNDETAAITENKKIRLFVHVRFRRYGVTALQHAHLRHDIIKGAFVPLLYNTIKEGGKNMKTKKIVIGAVSAVLALSLPVTTAMVAVAADDTVQISVGSQTVEPGGSFSVDVTLSDIPDSGLQCCQFSLEYDPSLVKISSITAGKLTETGASKGDGTASSLPLFNQYIDESTGMASVIWTTALDDPTYWMKGEGVLCTVKGTALKDVSGKAEIAVTATARETKPGSGVENTEYDLGYVGTSGLVRYAVKANNGTITIGDGSGSQETTGGQATTGGGSSSGSGLKGDANVDGDVTIADAVAILQSLANLDEYGLSEQGMKNADVAGDGDGVNTDDALYIQEWDAGLHEL